MSAEPATVTQAYRFALDPTPAQARALASHAGAARFAFNRMLTEVKADLDRYHAGEQGVLEGWSLPALRRHWNANKDSWAVNAESGEPWWAENSKEAYNSGLAAWPTRWEGGAPRGRERARGDRCGSRGSGNAPGAWGCGSPPGRSAVSPTATT